MPEPEIANFAEYVVVGSGAGGGPLAARLAEAGRRVLLLEAGGDGGKENLNYQVPAFHGASTEDERMSWGFFVQHYGDPERARQDTKFDERFGGVFYPRAGTIGGCTAHNAMITVYPHEGDWDEIAGLTGDDSWRADNVRKYFQRLEDCLYAGQEPDNPSGHGYGGWLGTETGDPTATGFDAQLLALIKSAAIDVLTETLLQRFSPVEVLRQILRDAQAALHALARHPLDPVAAVKETLAQRLDPHDWRTSRARLAGIFSVPLATRKGARNGPRELLLSVQQQFPDRLKIETEALVTRVLFREGDPTNTATGVEYLKGARLYRAAPGAGASGPGEPRQAFASREVILAGGAFNTPQLLMLSGIGPKKELERLGIPARKVSEGVGQNLQDRYEVGVVSQMKRDLALLGDNTFRAPGPGEQPDAALAQWLASDPHAGLYATNGAVLAVIKRSAFARTDDPDLFLFLLPGYFRGYFRGYSAQIEEHHDRVTWAILKAHTANKAGTVTLRSLDPRDVPEIHFRYFDEGSQGWEADRDALVEGVQAVARIMGSPHLAALVTRTRLLPDVDVRDEAKVREFVTSQAWGHHACGTCRIGGDGDEGAVLDSRFRVRGAKNLRVVDASIFPSIPGFFIVTSIYVASEKAAEVILADAAGEPA